MFINDCLKIISNFHCDSTLTHGLFYFLITKDLEIFLIIPILFIKKFFIFGRAGSSMLCVGLP